MSKKTCKDCLHCSIEDASEAYCSGMPWHYPFGGSDTVTLDKEACEHFLERDKPTVFDRITASPEVLAEKLTYWQYDPEQSRCGWTNNIIVGELYKNYHEAITATVAKLKEVAE